MRPPSALATIGTFGVAVAIASVGTASALITLAPEPRAPRYSPWAAMTALCCGGQGFVRYASSEPRGRRIPWMEQLFAIEMQRDPSDVRVVWLENPAEGRSGSAERTVAATRQFTAAELAWLGWRDRRSLLTEMQPAIVASVKQSGPGWRSVRPDPPWLSAWRLMVLAILAGSLAFLTGLALLLARYLTRPFRRLADALESGSPVLPAGGPRELRDAATVIAEGRRRLEEEVSERSRILAAIAHDLRTPLTALRLRVETVQDAKRERMIRDIERMQNMLREILEFTQAAAVPRERFAVRRLLEETVAEMPGAEGRLRLLPGKDAWVEVPPLGLRRAVENLMRNALDYAGHGDVEVTAAGNIITISVRDHGPGLPSEDVERLMRAFERGEGSRNRATGGAGLGLSIVQGFAAQEGGSFALSADPSGGTRASLNLPTASAVTL